MAYYASVPDSANNWSDDLSAMAANFDLLRQFFMTGVAPVSGASITYGYNSSNELTTVTFGGTLAGSATFTYTSGALTSESWSVYGATVAVTHTYTSGNLTKTEITIT